MGIELTHQSAWPHGDSEMAARMRTFPWSRNPLGSPEQWPHSLKAIVEFTLASNFPTKVLWGPELIQLYNDPFAAIIGDKHPKGLGQRAAECWAEILHLSAPLYARALAGETLTIHNQNWKIFRHGAEEVSFMAYLTPLRDDNGAIAGLHVVTVETTGQDKAAAERDRAEQALRESEARLKTATDLVGLCSYSWNPETGAVLADHRFKALCGLPADAEFKCESFLNAIHPEDRASVDAAIASAIDPAGEGIYRVECRVIGICDGVERWMSTHGQTIFAEGKPVQVIGAARDISERKRTEDVLRRLNSALEQRLKEQSFALAEATEQARRQELQAAMLHLAEMRAEGQVPEEREREGADARQRLSLLTRREREVLERLAAGYSNKTIASQLGLSVRTVEVHRSRMMQRLGVRHPAEAIRIAVTAQLAGHSTGTPGNGHRGTAN